jgi:hypothetical protein
LLGKKTQHYHYQFDKVFVFALQNFYNMKHGTRQVLHAKHFQSFLRWMVDVDLSNFPLVLVAATGPIAHHQIFSKKKYTFHKFQNFTLSAVLLLEP